VPAMSRAGLQIPGATMEEIERYAITKTLEATAGSTSRAAEILQMSVRKIQYKLHEYESAPKSARPSIASDAPDAEDDK
jgi:two-component system, NtrC family, response regulator HydG